MTSFTLKREKCILQKLYHLFITLLNIYFKGHLRFKSKLEVTGFKEQVGPGEPDKCRESVVRSTEHCGVTGQIASDLKMRIMHF